MKKKLDPNSPVVIDAALERLRRMTPEETMAFLTYRTPGIEETDMTGMLAEGTEAKRAIQVKRRALAS